MGSPVLAYDAISKLMPFVVSVFIFLLIMSEGYPSLRPRHHAPNHIMRMISAFAVLLAAGVLGTVVLLSNYYAAPVMDFPWMSNGFVPRSSLLLPMFAGFFGVPSLMLSMGSRPLPGITFTHADDGARPLSAREVFTMLLGGVMVGWLPGMTSGSATTACSPTMVEGRAVEDVSSASRFVWLYSAISTSGAVMSVGALFVIQRARSGSMGETFVQGEWFQLVPLMSAILLSMVVSSILSHWALGRFLPVLSRSSRFLCSRALAVFSLVFVTGLCLYLTGTRGALVMAASVSLGMLTPIAGIRRLQLMGSLLVPIWILFVTMM